MKVNHALNFHWCEMQLTTGLYPYKIEEIYGIVSYQCHLYYNLHVSHKCMGHMYVTSGLFSGSSGSTSVAHFNPGSHSF